MQSFADYAFYTGTFNGTAISAPDFDKLALDASYAVDYATLYRAGRVVADGLDLDAINDIKLATCAAAETIKRYESLMSAFPRDVKRESVGDLSVSYTSSDEVKAERASAINDGIAKYLLGHGLLYRGVDHA